MELIRDEGDITSNELMQEEWQQFVCYKEKSSKRFQELEEMIDEAVQKMKLIQRIRKQKVEEKFLSPSEWEVQKKQNRKVLSQKTSQNSPHHKLITPRFDELLGEDKVDWRSEEIICIALGPEDFFQPKKNSEQGNSYGAKELECTYDFRITPRKIKCNGKEELYEPIYDEEPVYDKEESEVISAFSTRKMVDSLPQVELRQGGEVFDSLQECEYQLCPESVYDEDPKEGMEYLYAQPIYDEDPREGMECWPEHEFILAALGGSHMHSSIFLQPELCTSESLEEQDIQDSPQKNVPPEDNNIPGNNLGEKLKRKGHSSFVNDNDIYNKLRNLPKINMSAKESVYDLQLVLTIENEPFLELNDLKNPLSHPSGELEWTEVGDIYASNIGLQLRSLKTANSYGLGGLAYENKELRELSNEEVVYDLNLILTFDPGGPMQSSWSNSVTTLVDQQHVSQKNCLAVSTKEEPAKYLINTPNKVLKDKQGSELIRYKKGKSDEVARTNSICGQLGHLQWQERVKLEFLATKLLLKDFPQLSKC